MKIVNIGLAGFGTIGTGLVRLLMDSSHGERLKIKTVLVRDASKPRPGLPEGSRLTSRPEDLWEDPEISLVVELMGGVEEPFRIASESLARGKGFVTANKNLLAEKGPEIYRIAREKGCFIGLEASVCGGIPVIRVLKEALRADRVLSLEGIVNGTTNYILTRMSEESAPYETVLREAQIKGFAEPDPHYDVSGKDALCKAGILATLAFGSFVDFRKIPVSGIEDLQLEDIRQAGAMGYRIKLIAAMQRTPEGRLEASVGPVLIPSEHPLASIRNEFNAVLIESAALNRTLLSGKGAGPAPTAVSVLADLLDFADGHWDPPSESEPFLKGTLGIEKENLRTSRFYLRLAVPDRPGILASVAGIFANQKINLASVLQPEVPEEGTPASVPLILTTHAASQASLKKALVQLDEEGFGRAVVLRIQDQ